MAHITISIYDLYSLLKKINWFMKVKKENKVQDLPFEPVFAPLFPVDEVVFGFFAGAAGLPVVSVLDAGDGSPLATGFSFFSGSDFFLNLSKKDI